MAVAVKICGLADAAGLDAAIRHGARYVGFVFFAASPRHLSFERARALAARVPAHVERVGVVVDAGDDALAQAVAAAGLNVLQLHGGEDRRRAAAIGARFGVRTMKVVRVAQAADLDAAAAFEEAVDMLMFDARAPRGATRPGGNATAFDWRLLAGRRWRRPWLLSGGLDAGNLARAVAVSGAAAVDVSSGVERAPGRKDPERIRAFLERAAAL